MSQKLTWGQMVLFAVGVTIVLFGAVGLWNRFPGQSTGASEQHQRDLAVQNDSSLGVFEKRTSVLRLAKKQHRRAFELARAWLESENKTIRALGFQVIALSSLPEDHSQVIEYYRDRVPEGESQTYLRFLAQGYLGDPRLRELAEALAATDPLRAFPVHEALYKAGDDKKASKAYFLKQAESQNNLYWQKARLFLLQNNVEPRQNFETLLSSFKFKVLERSVASDVVLTLAKRASEFESEKRVYSHLRPDKVWYIQSALIDSLIVGCPKAIDKIVQNYLSYKELETRGVKKLVSSLLRMDSKKNMPLVEKLMQTAKTSQEQFQLQKLVDQYKTLPAVCN